MRASEAVCGFVAWLLTRQKTVFLGSKHQMSTVVDLMELWFKANKLQPPRKDYAKHICFPEEQK